jgi:hypothetical protein
MVSPSISNDRAMLALTSGSPARSLVQSASRSGESR